MPISLFLMGVWVRIKPPGDHRFWSMFPLARATHLEITLLLTHSHGFSTGHLSGIPRKPTPPPARRPTPGRLRPDQLSDLHREREALAPAEDGPRNVRLRLRLELRGWRTRACEVKESDFNQNMVRAVFFLFFSKNMW